MPDLVVVPCCYRPELLAETCRRLLAAEHAAEHLFLFRVDRGWHVGIRDVLADFPLPHEVWWSPPHPYRGNSFNILEGYRRALELAPRVGARLIYLVEEDILVSRGFFHWHRLVHATAAPEIASACQDQNRPRPPQDPARFYLRSGYQSLGVSLRLWVVAEILVHAGTDYYRRLGQYLREKFPSSRLGNHYGEQDGLIDRLIEADGWRVAYPWAPYAYHAGEYGYHRGHRHVIHSVPEERVPPPVLIQEDPP